MLNFATLAGVYQNARTLKAIIDRRPDMRDQLLKLANDPAAIAELKDICERLDSHLRVMGFAEVTFTKGE